MRKQISKVYSFFKNNKKAVYILITAIILAVIAIAELIISNIDTLFLDKDEYSLDIELLDKEPIKLKRLTDSSKTLYEVPKDIYALKVGVKAERVFGEPITLKVAAFDKKNGDWYTTVNQVYLAPGPGEVNYHTVFLDYELGAKDKIKLSFSGIYDNAEVVSVIANPEDTTEFSLLRFGIISLIALAIYNFAFWGLNQEYFDIKNKKHLIVGAVTVAFCIACSAIFCNVFVGEDNGVRVAKDIQYPLVNEVEDYTPYIQQADAFLKGQLYLDVEVPKELLELENPYDRSERDDSGIPYLWDRALYNEHYYSYFGVGPILNVYLPYYFLNGAMPSDTMVVSFYGVVATVFTCLFLYAFVVIFKKRVFVSLLSVAAVAVTFSSGVLLMARSTAHFYYLVVVAGMAYFAAFMFFLLLALNCKHKVARPILFAVASLCYGFILLSRLNIALVAAFVVVPFVYFGVIRNNIGLDKENSAFSNVVRTTKGKIIDIACLGSFVLVCGIFLCCYNYMRFDSIFEFGTTYQLTVSDISQNKISFGNMWEFVYHYFIHPFDVKGIFPYFRLTTDKLYTYGSYMYVDTGMGLFAIPLMLGLFFGLGTLRNKKKTPFAKSLTVSAVAGVIIVSFINFCIGGVIYRYTCDVTLLCAVMAVLFMFSFNERIENSGAGEAVCRLEKILMLVSIFVCFIASVSVHSYLADYDAKDLIILQKAFS